MVLGKEAGIVDGLRVLAQNPVTPHHTSLPNLHPKLLDPRLREDDACFYSAFRLKYLARTKLWQ